MHLSLVLNILFFRTFCHACLDHNPDAGRIFYKRAGDDLFKALVKQILHRSFQRLGSITFSLVRRIDHIA